MINPSPLKLERYYITQLNVSAKLGFEVKQGAAVTQLDSREILVENKIFGHKDDPNKMLCELKVQSSPTATQCPYDFSVTIVGFFQIAVASQKERGALVSLAEPTLLYSVAREVILSQTERGPFPGALLPVITFSEGSSAQVAAGKPAIPAGI